MPEVTDGSCLSQQPIKNSVRSQGVDPNRNAPPAPVRQPAATLAGVQSQYTLKHLICMSVSLLPTAEFKLVCNMWNTYHVHYKSGFNMMHQKHKCPQYCILSVFCCAGERVEGLRQVLIPRGLTENFLSLARSNTARGIETCGVLCGQLVSRMHFLSRCRLFSARCF